MPPAASPPQSRFFRRQRCTRGRCSDGPRSAAHELMREALCARASHEARLAGSGGSAAVNRRATRYLGELLIRTGWRLVGPEAPATGVRPRLGAAGPGVDGRLLLSRGSAPIPRANSMHVGG